MIDLGLPVNLYIKKYKHKYLSFYHAIKDGISNGIIPDGTRLPSSRELASQYSISRGTANLVYEMLAADGYIETRSGSGTFVTQHPISSEGDGCEVIYQKSHWGDRLNDYQPFNKTDALIKYDLSSQRPLAEWFPINEWKRAVKLGLEQLNYLVGQDDPDPKGLFELRQGIANHLMTARGMKTNVGEIVILNGSVHGMAILAQLLIRENEDILVEDPTYFRVRNMIRTVGGRAIPLKLNKELPKSKLAYVTPSSQYPTGHTMPFDDRLKLLQWAKENNSLIIEDDIDSLFNRKTRLLEPLKVLDNQNRVIYLGTFAFTILTHLRIGYAVIPNYLMTDFLKTKHIFEPFTTSLYEQAAISHFISSGNYAKHIRKMRRIYRQKYDHFIRSAKEHIDGVFTWVETDTGMHVFGWWNGQENDFALFTDKCNEKGLFWEDPSPYFMYTMKPGAVFHYGSISEPEIEKAVFIMKEVYQSINDIN